MKGVRKANRNAAGDTAVFCKIKNETEGMEKYDILSGAAIKSGRLKAAAKE